MAGPIASPMLPPVPCMPMAKPRRSGYWVERIARAGGCQKTMTMPSSVMETRAIQKVVETPTRNMHTPRPRTESPSTAANRPA